ncbi:MAG: cyanophycinase [bacterium]|nr:cyanophycinase [bacterium]
MKKRFYNISVSLLIQIIILSSVSFAQEITEYGPSNGTLVIVGGAAKDTVIYNKFIKLAGGPDANFIIVPTSGGNRDREGNIREFKEENVIRSWLARGLKNVRMLHTHDPAVADTEEFVRDLRKADAVWFNGGRQWNCVDSYMNTLTLKEFHKVLERGGVIGGSSAGATIQGEYLVRGDTKGSNIVMTEEENHFWGFKFLRKTAIDQHIDARNRWDHIIPVIEKYPDFLGIGLSENTAIVVKGDKFEVIGNWKVAIHDNTTKYHPWEKPYYVLGPGGIYNMKTRKIERLDSGGGENRRNRNR